MSKRKSTIVFVVGGVVLFTVGFLILYAYTLLENPYNPINTNGTEQSGNDKAADEEAPDPNDGKVVLEGENLRDYSYALIDNTGNLVLKNEEDGELPITLENRDWKDIRWSPEGNYISVLGKQIENDNYDLFLFDIEANEFEQKTFYENEDSGIESYVWYKEDYIYYSQGIAPDNWLHQYNIIGEGALKLTRVDGTIATSSPEDDYFVYITGNGFVVFDSETTEQITSSEDYLLDFGEVQKIITLFDSDTFLVLNTEDELFSVNVVEKRAREVTRDFAFLPLCSEQTNSAIGVLQSELPEKLTFVRVNFSNDLESRLLDYRFPEDKFFIDDSLQCTKSDDFIIKYSANALEGNVSSREWFGYNGREILQFDSDIFTNIVEQAIK